MKFKTKLLYILIIFFSQVSLFSQGGFIVEGGTLLHLDGNAKLVIEDGKFATEGYINFQESEVIFKGNSASNVSTIYGNPFPEFYHLTIEKSQHEVKLLNHISVSNHLRMIKNDLELNGNNIYLIDQSKIVNEREDSRIKGANGGFISKIVDLNNPIAENPGAIGVAITSNSNLGTVTILRGHDIQNPNGSESIARYFDISPTNNQNLNATLRFYYFDAELNSILESELSFFKKSSGNPWTAMGIQTLDQNQNYAELDAIDDFSDWTLASSGNPLPLELLSFQAQKVQETAILDWQTERENNLSHFEIQKSKNGLDFFNIAEVEALGTTNEIQSYQFIDHNPFNGVNYYRLKIWDLNSSSEYSNIEALIFQDTDAILSQIYPNPISTNECFLNISLQKESPISIEAIDLMGRSISIQSHLLERGETTLKIDTRKWAVGLYFIKLEIGGQIIIKKVEKV